LIVNYLLQHLPIKKNNYWLATFISGGSYDKTSGSVLFHDHDISEYNNWVIMEDKNLWGAEKLNNSHTYCCP